jgi:hypothetical protein
MPRRIIQSILVSLRVTVTPFFWLFSLSALATSPQQEETLRTIYPERSKIDMLVRIIVFFIISAGGITALCSSILVDLKKAHGKLRWALVTGLFIELLLDVFLISGSIFSPEFSGFQDHFFLSWLFLGPLCVGIWNLVALFRPQDRIDIA